MKLKFNGFLVLLVVLVAQLTFAQERSVSGVVSDNAGLPLPGVSVLVKGTKTGAQTDFDGKYSIKASSSQVLIFSYIGMKTQEITASSTNLNVKQHRGFDGGMVYEDRKATLGSFYNLGFHLFYFWGGWFFFLFFLFLGVLKLLLSCNKFLQSRLMQL